MGADQVVSPATGPLDVQIEAAYTHVAVGFPVRFVAHIEGRLLATQWDFGDGTVVSNQAFISHAWSAPGTYTVSLTGYNDSFPEGVKATVTVEVVEAGYYYVNQANPTPAYPYTSWQTAAQRIQVAIGAGTLLGRLVLVSDGVYESGAVVVAGSMTNRVALTNPVVVRSANGPELTVIRGAGPLGDGEVRCGLVGKDAVLSGFMLTNGHAWEGGGVWCESRGVVTNCTLTGNSASSDGGGAAGSILYDCTLTGNSAGRGGGAWGGEEWTPCTLYNCILTGNSAGSYGGAASGDIPYSRNCSLYNCTLAGNYSAYQGGGSSGCTLYNCTLTGNSALSPGGGAWVSTLYNCIVWDNDYAGCVFAYSCTTPLPEGVGNISINPLFVNAAAGDFRLRAGSPCIDAGANLSALMTTDLDGHPRPLDGNGDGLARFDLGAYEVLLPSADSNGDGIPDGWCWQHGLSPVAPDVADGDPDGNAATTAEEWMADTAPTDAESCFHIHHIEVGLNGSPVTIHFVSSSNRVYTLRSATNLAPGSWSDVAGQANRRGSGGMDTLSDTNAAPQKFYRVGVKLP